jgi:hypothetical protein
MTGSARRRGTPIGPPWSVDLLADLHAGVLDTETEAELRPRVEADPEARAVLAALDATVADLAALPALTMPEDVAARIDAALSAQPRPVAAVVDIGAARSRRNRRLGWGTGLLTAAAVTVGVAVAALPGGRDTSPPAAQPAPTRSTPTGNTAPGSAQPPLAVQSNGLGSAVSDVLKAQNYGPLDNQETLAGCLKGGGITSTSKPLGVSPITLDGRPAVMALLPAGTAGQLRIVVLDPQTCGPDNPNGVLANSTIAPPPSR